MATNRDLLKEAIADAKAVKEMAIANAKQALEEAFTPQLKNMLSAKLQEMEEKEEELEEGFGSMDPDPLDSHGNVEDNGIFEEEEDELDLDELLAELDDYDEMPEAPSEEETDANQVYEAKDDEADEAEEDEAEEEGGESEALDLEDMSEDDLKKFIEDVIADMVETGELEAGEGGEGEGEDMEGEMEAGEEEDVDIEELLAEILAEEDEEEIEEGIMDKIVKAVNRFGSSGAVEDLKKDIPTKIAVGKKAAAQGKIESFTEPSQEEIDAIMKAAKEDGGTGKIAISKEGKLIYQPGSETKGAPSASTHESLNHELSEAYKVIKHLRSELNEVNLLNAKLLYTNKIFKGKNLTESQKVKVLETFDKAKTVSEVKLIHETLNTSLNTSRKPINESKGSASKAMSTTRSKSIINENDAFARMRELAFYSQKH